MKHAVLRSIQAVAILAGCGLLGWYIYQMTSGMAEEPDAAEAEAEKKPRLLSVEFTTLQSAKLHRDATAFLTAWSDAKGFVTELRQPAQSPRHPPRLGEPGQTGRGNPVPACGGTRPGDAGPLTSKRLSKNPSRQSLVRE